MKMKIYIGLIVTLLSLGFIDAGTVISADQNLSKTTFYVA
jgi:hypothetical protein